MLQQIQEKHIAAETMVGFNYTDLVKQWTKGGVLLFGLGTLGMLGHKCLNWLSSSFYGTVPSNNPVNEQPASSSLQFSSSFHFSNADNVVSIINDQTVAPIIDFSLRTDEVGNNDQLTLEYRTKKTASNHDYCDAEYVLVKGTAASSLSCSSGLMIGLFSLFLTRNPLYLGVASLLCAQETNGQIVDGQITDQWLNVGDEFELNINMTELFGGPITDIVISQVDGSALPDWLTASPSVVGSFAIESQEVVISGNLAYVAGIRTFKILDVSNVAQPVLKSSLDTTYAMGVAINGDLAYVADNWGGFKILDVSNVTQPVLKGSMPVHNAIGVAIKGSLAYVTDADATGGGGSPGGLRVIDVSNATQPILKGSLATTDARGVDLSGTMVYVADKSGGLRIIDVSNVTRPILKGSLPTTEAIGVAISGNMAYVADATAGLKIIDVSDVTQPVLKGSFSIIRANGVAVSSSGDLVYVADGPTWGGWLKVIDVSNPTQPILRWTLATTTSAWGVTISDNLAYLSTSGELVIIDLTSWKISGLPIVNNKKYHISISAKNSLFQKVKKNFFITTDYVPTAIGNKSVMPGKSLTLYLNADTLFQDKDADNNLGLGIKVNGPNNNVGSLPEFMQFQLKPFIQGRIAEIWGGAVAISDDLAYVPGWHKGLEIIDVSDVAHPVFKGNLTTTLADAVVVSGSLAYLADGTGGLKVVDVSNAAIPILRGRLATSYAMAIAVNGYLVYVADGYGGLRIIDVSNATNPILRSSLATIDYATGVAVNGNLVYMADGNGGLRIIDVSNVDQPVLRGNLTTVHASGITISGDIAYVNDFSQGLYIIDVSNATQPILRGKFAAYGTNSVAIMGNLAYLACGNGGLKIIDVSNVTQPILRGSLASDRAYPIGVVISGNFAYVTDTAEDFKIVNLNNYQLTANPTHNDEGNYEIIVTATDQLYASASVSFVLRVEGVPRLIKPLASQIALIGQPFSYFVPEGTFSDPNNDIITYLSQSKPDFLSFNPSSATFWGIPKDSDKGEYNITIFATDRITLPTSAILNLLVHYAPTLSKPISNQVADVGKPFIFIIDPKTFADKDLVYHLTYSAKLSSQYPLPYWLNFNNQTRTFSGTPQEYDKGSLNLLVTVDDGKQGQASATFDLTVEHFPRLVQNFTTVYAAIGHSFFFNAINYFADHDDNTLQFSATTNGQALPQGLIFDSLGCKFSSTPQKIDKGTIPITITASDALGGKVQAQFNLTIDDYTKVATFLRSSEMTVDNRSPVLAAPLLRQTFSAGTHSEFSIKSAFQDPDGDSLVFSADMGGAENWLTLDPNTGLFAGTPSSTDAALYSTRYYLIGITATDPANKTTIGSFTLSLLGPSLAEKLLNSFFALSGVAVAIYGYYQKKYLLWNWFRKSGYKKPDVYLDVDQKGAQNKVLYQVQFDAKKIKTINMVIWQDGCCVKRNSRCCKIFANNEGYSFSGRTSIDLFDWLRYDHKANQFILTNAEPDAWLLHRDIELQIIGADNRIMEQVKIKGKLGRVSLVVATAISEKETATLSSVAVGGGEEKLRSESPRAISLVSENISSNSFVSPSSSSKSVHTYSIGLFGKNLEKANIEMVEKNGSASRTLSSSTSSSSSLSSLSPSL